MKASAAAILTGRSSRDAAREDLKAELPQAGGDALADLFGRRGRKPTMPRRRGRPCGRSACTVIR
jgi:hypothetical protein